MSLISFLEGGIADAFGENNHNSTTPRKTPSGAASSSDAPSVVNASGAKSAITLSTTAATTSSTALASQQDRKLKHDEIQMSLSIQWATGCILTKQFAVSLVQTCPNGAHDLKTIFFSDFDHYLARRLDEKAGQSQSAKDAAAAAMGGSIASKSRWKKVARKRGELVAAMTGVLDAEGGDFIARDDQTSRVKAGKMLDVGMLGGSDSDDDETGGSGRRFAKLQQTSAASQTATHSHFSNFLNVANGLLTRKTARTLVFLDAPQFVLRALKVMCLLDVVPQHFSDDIESLEINEMLAALRWRQVDGLGLRAPMSETEQASDYLSDDDDPASKFRREDYDADGYFKIVQQRDRRRSQRWEREVRERWYSLRELLAVEGQLQYFTRLPILTFALYDLFLGANHRRTTTNTVHWNDVVEYLGDCSGGSGGDNDAKGATAGGAAPTTSDTAARAMREAIHTIAFPDVNRAAVIIPWLSRGVIIALEIDRKEQETLSMFDSSVLRPNRAHVWPQHFGKISHVAVCTELQAMIVATFDVVRLIDGDNYVVKFMHRVEEPITALQWIEESSMLVVGTRAGSVEVFRLRNLDTWFFGCGFFGCGSRVVTSVPSEDNFLNKKLHSDAITTVGQRVLPGTTILTASMDCSLTSWSLESNVVRRVVGAVALGFEALPSLALVFAYGVELFPMLWSYTVANSKPIILGGAKKGIRPHQARIIGVALLSHPKNSGCSIDRLGGVKVWDLWEQGLLQSWCAMDHIPPGLNTRGLTFQNFFVSPNGRELTIVSSRMFHKIELMKAEDARRAPIASNAPVHALAHCPELRLFVSAQRNSVTIWNAVTAAPITTYEDVSRVPGDEILSMKVYESPNREIRLGTKCGCVITMSLGNGSIKNVYRHASHKDIQCFVFVPVLELLVLSCEKSAKSVVPGDEKSFVLPQKTALGFADVCIHHTTMLLIAAHDDEVRCTVWDASPTTPNLWIRLCDVTIPTKYLDRSLGSEGGRKDSVHHHDNGASPSPDRAASSETKEESLGLGTVVCALLEDFNGTAFFAMSDTTSQFYICQLIVQLDGKDISLGRNDHNSAADTTAEDNDDEDNDAKGGAGRRSTALEAASRRVAHRRKSTLFDKCVGVMHNIGVGEASVKPSGGTSTAISNDGPRAVPMLGNAGKKDVARKVSIVVRQIAPHRLHATNNTGASLPPGKVDQDVIPTITSIRYLNAFGLLYIADDLGRVSIYDIAGVLLQSTQSLASSPSAPHLTPQASMSLASGSSGNTVGTVSRGRPMMKTTSTVTTNFKNTRPQSIHDLVLAEQIWGKTDLPFAVTLDDRIAEMGEVFQTFTTKQSSVSQATKERNRKRREQHGGESAADGPSETGLNSAPSAGNDVSWGASRESNPLSEAKASDSAESKSDFLICIESQSGAFSSDDFTPPSKPMDSHHAVISPNPAPPLPQFMLIPSLAGGGANPASVIAPSGLHVKVDVREGSSLKVDLGATARFQGSVVNSGGGPPHTSGGTFGDMSVTSRAATMKFQNAHRVKLGPPPPVAETPKHNSSVVAKASSFGTAIPDLNNSSNRMLELFIIFFF
ncbi:Hypothetical protein, putative [Bodo saltans]|uniref:WD40 repeat-containing protein n=1 Tax=Bodo saltans TaxID=75058 RepID=A0A0S4KJL6_BODSA|nr:Hypothetical protein, putative [Bodo saltans]|eukprot:CUI14579.1 Hypothetical protein, putative [Bodo saltans]